MDAVLPVGLNKVTKIYILPRIDESGSGDRVLLVLHIGTVKRVLVGITRV